MVNETELSALNKVLYRLIDLPDFPLFTALDSRQDVPKCLMISLSWTEKDI